VTFVAGMVVRPPRRRVNILARMRAGGAPVGVCIRDISPRSMLLEGATAPSPGTFVEIIGQEAFIAGQVIWSKDGRFGVRTRERLNVKATAIDLRSLRLTADELAGPSCGRSSNSHAIPEDRGGLSHRAESSRILGRRIEHVAVATCVAVAAVLVAAGAYHTLARPFAAVAAGSSLPK
jgi:hypothetical protein